MRQRSTRLKHQRNAMLSLRRHKDESFGGRGTGPLEGLGLERDLEARRQVPSVNLAQWEASYSRNSNNRVASQNKNMTSREKILV